MNATPTKAAAYMRVSSDKQDQANQRPDVFRLADARGFDTSCRVFEEVESSAKARPVYEAMMASARRGEFRALVFWSLDRLGRNMWETVAAIKELDRIGVQVVSVKEPWFDTGGPVRDLLLAIFAWIANHERDRLRERTKAGLRTARERGVRLGRPEVTFDLDKAVAMRQDGWSFRRIAAAVGVSVGTLHGALSSEARRVQQSSAGTDRPTSGTPKLRLVRPRRSSNDR